MLTWSNCLSWCWGYLTLKLSKGCETVFYVSHSIYHKDKGMLVCSNTVQNIGWNSKNGLIFTESQVGKDHEDHLVLTHIPHVHLTMSSVLHLHISWTPPGTVFSTPVFHWRFVFVQDSLQRHWDNWTKNITGSVVCLILVTPYSKEWIWNTWGKQCMFTFLDLFLFSLHAFPTPDWNTVSSTICCEKGTCVSGGSWIHSAKHIRLWAMFIVLTVSVT